uniref:Uncharacterized protein n=1 Tax=Glossina austeni TaxID=7395 RepID=A0A1A9VGC2_GLOAU
MNESPPYLVVLEEEEEEISIYYPYPSTVYYNSVVKRRDINVKSKYVKTKPFSIRQTRNRKRKNHKKGCIVMRENEKKETRIPNVID